MYKYTYKCLPLYALERLGIEKHVRMSPAINPETNAIGVWLRAGASVACDPPISTRLLARCPTDCGPQNPPVVRKTTMRSFCIAALLAVASAFTTQPTSFTVKTANVGERASGVFPEQSSAHRTRKATIVMDGKANGECSRRFTTGLYMLTCRDHSNDQNRMSSDGNDTNHRSLRQNRLAENMLPAAFIV
jgi:hypothetical protein